MKTFPLNSDVFFNKMRTKEYSRLDKSGHVYLDYTGGNLYPQSLLDTHFQYLSKGVYGNPHSTSPTSSLSEKFVAEARTKVLNFFNAHDYYCIFTPNASGALQIIGECYPFSSDSHLLLTADNHNSVNGIREYCRGKGGKYTYSRMNCEDLTIHEPDLNKNLELHQHKQNKLFAFPAQSNVSGVRHSLDWIKKAQALHWDVLLDAAAFVPTSKLDLSVYSPDFVALSFYKIFGYPTGIGCLLVKKSKFGLLKKPSYAGGTITLSAVGYPGYFLKQDHGKFENGTINYLNIPAITNGINFISAIGMDRISSRINDLNDIILYRFVDLKHSNNKPMVKLYGPLNNRNRGGTFMFNFLNMNGHPFPLLYIERLAIANKISFRTGCFCNPGIDELNHDIRPDQLKQYFLSRTHGDYYDFINFTGRSRGAIRISIGFPTILADIDKFISFAKMLRNKKSPGDRNVNLHTGAQGVIERVF